MVVVINAQIHGWIECRNEWMNERMDGWMDGRLVTLLISVCQPYQSSSSSSDIYQPGVFPLFHFLKNGLVVSVGDDSADEVGECGDEHELMVTSL